MTAPRFDGTQKLFQIGLKPIALQHWIAPSERLPRYLAEKARLTGTHSEQVFAAEAGSEAAQDEVLQLLANHLVAYFPDLYRRDGNTIDVAPAGRAVELVSNTPPLQRAAMLVEDDLVLMRRGHDGWRLVAASLCFPSSWDLREKFGRLIDQVHQPVPDFGPETRNNQLIGRMFDNMRPDAPSVRWNFSFYGDADLFHPNGANSATHRFGIGPEADPVFLRTERQTLRRLRESGDILFTIGIAVEPLETAAARTDGPAIIARLRGQIAGLSDEQLAYKGLSLEREHLLARLDELAQPSPNASASSR